MASVPTQHERSKKSNLATLAIDPVQLLHTLTALKKGDFSARMPPHFDGIAGKIYDAVNDVAEQNERLARELARVAHTVGHEGRLSEPASLKGAEGSYADCMTAINALVGDVLPHIARMTRVLEAAAKGNLSQELPLEIDGRELRGQFLASATVVNKMLTQLSGFASEVTRVAREVGTEGRLGGQAVVDGVGGIWKDLTDNVNSMAANLTNQVRNIAQVTTAIARGDLSMKITVDARGEILELKNTINTMVDQLNSFASEVTRVSREVGTEGKLGGQANVSGLAGIWRDLTESVNWMAGNLTDQVRNIAQVTTAVAKGDLSTKITVDARGEILALKNTVNTMVDQLNSFASEVTRVAREVGTEGKLGGQAHVRGVTGIWKDLADNVNSMASNLTDQVRNIASVTTGVAKGDLSRQITVDARGEILELKNTINTMVDQLNSFASEVTRVAREVGTEGKLGGQAYVKGVTGIWKDLADNVNSMASNLTDQVRNIASVTTGVAKGDLSRQITVDARGEILELKNTINTMVEQLGSFASEVTRVAREVGTEGKFGGQATVKGVGGIWKDLTDNVNLMATNLSTRVRNITEQDWLKTNLAKFSQMVQGQRDLATVAQVTLSELARLIGAQQGVLYIADNENGETMLRHLASYAYRARSSVRVKFGEGLLGQCALEKNMIVLNNVPGEHITITSGLGESKPACIVVLPVLFEGQVKAVIELASLRRFNDVHLQFLDQFAGGFGIVLNTIAANMRTEELLKQSQALNSRLAEQAESLKSSEELLKGKQHELQIANEELKEKAALLSDQKAEVERKNREVEQAKRSLEEKAEQLALTSRYKSEFLANMSHELRTPINSLLILSELLADNSEGNLSAKQIEFLRTIHASGTDLIALINDILDLSKIESGTITLEQGNHALTDLGDYVERTFGPMAESKGLLLQIEMDSDVPKVIRTDFKRLKQILKNLLANAFKFTEHGEISMRVRLVKQTEQATRIAFDVSDTGIGIPTDQQQVIFEAFRQADGTTSRKYGGTGLGLSISRELAKLLGGEIKVQSNPGVGSTFSLQIPLEVTAPAAPIASPIVVEHFGRVAQTKSSQPTALFIGDENAFDRAALGDATGFRARVALRADAALARAMETPPDVVVLDAQMSDSNAWTVLDRFKHDPATRHVPTIMVASEEHCAFALSLGAIACVGRPAGVDALRLPLERARQLVHVKRRTMLLMCTDEAEAKQALDLLRGDEIDITVSYSGSESIQLIAERAFDCLALNPFVNDMPPEAFLAKLEQMLAPQTPPIVLYFGASWVGRTQLDPALRRRLQQKSALRVAGSAEELLNMTSLFLHRPEGRLASTQRRIIEKLRGDDPLLRGKTVLIVDDDPRNVFALSNILERHKMRVIVADGGVRALELLKSTPEVDIILMDIMMAGVDGYQATRAIREMQGLESVPIIAVTALAMKGDRDRCIQAGATDYLTKPIERDQLLATLRVALLRREVSASG